MESICEYWTTLNPNPTLSLTLGLELGLTPGKTISVENLKPSTKHKYRRRRPGKNI